METTSETRPVTPGELIEVAAGLRRLGASGFNYRGCEVMFFEPLPLEFQSTTGEEEEEEDDEEPKAKRLDRARRLLLDADIHGSA